MAIEDDMRTPTGQATGVLPVGANDPVRDSGGEDVAQTPAVAVPDPTAPRHRLGMHSRASEQQPSVEAPPWPAAHAHNLHVSDWLYRSREASLLWLVARLWLGYQWADAGYQKIWGSERSAFWFGGAGVKGYVAAGVAGSASGKGGASYGWWAAVLHDVVLPNASWIARLVSVGELAIGVALVLGLFTGVAAFAGLILSVTYMFSGSAGVNPMFALLEVLLVLAWRNAGWVGLDRLVLQNAWTPHRLGSLVGRMTHRRVPAPVAS